MRGRRSCRHRTRASAHHLLAKSVMIRIGGAGRATMRSVDAIAERRRDDVAVRFGQRRLLRSCRRRRPRCRQPVQRDDQGNAFAPVARRHVGAIGQDLVGGVEAIVARMSPVLPAKGSLPALTAAATASADARSRSGSKVRNSRRPRLTFFIRSTGRRIRRRATPRAPSPRRPRAWPRLVDAAAERDLQRRCRSAAWFETSTFEMRTVTDVVQIEVEEVRRLAQVARHAVDRSQVLDQWRRW